MAENYPPETEYVTIPDLCERWGMRPTKVHRLLEDHYLAGVRVGGVLRIPADFAPGAEPLPPLRGTLLALRDAGLSNDQAVAWILNDNDELGERPIKALLDGRKSAVRRATQSLAW